MTLYRAGAIFFCLQAATALRAATNFPTLFGAAQISATALDAAGNIYVAGSTASASVPVTAGAFQQTFIQSICGYVQGSHGTQGPPIPCPHAFVAKVDATGKQLVWATYLGGELQDAASAICVDAAGNVYVAGLTTSAMFPTTAGAWYTSATGDFANGFIAKLSSDGSKLIFSTYLPGGSGNAIAVDGAGAVFVAGSATGSTFPTTANAYQQTRFPGNSDAFVLKLNAAGSSASYSTLLGGTFADYANAIAIDSRGDAFVAGVTASIPAYAALAGGNLTPFPFTTGALYRPVNGADVFVAELNPNGSALIYSSVFGGQGNDSISSIALDGAGAVWFTGSTDSLDWPLTPNAARKNYGRGMAGALSPDGSHLIESTFLAGPGGEIVLGAKGPILTGFAITPDLATTPDAELPCASSSWFNPSFTMAFTRSGDVSYASYLAAPPFAISPSGNIVLQSQTALFDLFNIFTPPAPGVRCVVNAANFIRGSVAPGEIVSIFGPGIGPAQPVGATLTSSGSVPTQLGGMRVLFGGFAAPLLYVSSRQINAVVPFEIADQTSVAVQVEANGAAAIPQFTQAVAQTVPGIFTFDGSGQGQAAAFNQDGSINSASNPAAQGSIVSFFATGIGPMKPQPVDGFVPSAPTSVPKLPVTLYIGGAPAVRLQYVGDAPQLVEGAVQINAVAPEGLTPGPQTVFVVAGDIATSPTVTVYVR